MHHGTQVRRDHRNRVEHHPRGVVVTAQEGGDHLQTLQGTGFALPLAVGDDLAKLLGLGLEIEGLQALLDGLRAHVPGEVLAVSLLHVPVEDLVALQVLYLQRLEPVPDGLGTVDAALVLVADLASLLLGTVGDLTLDVCLGALGLKLGEVLLQLRHPALDVRVPVLLQLLDEGLVTGLKARKVAVTGLLIHVGDHVRGEVDDLLKVLRRDVEQVPEARWHALEVPDVGDGRRQLDVPHALTAHVGAGHLDAAALADNSLEAHALVLAAVALPVPGRTEDLLAEEAVALRL